MRQIPTESSQFCRLYVFERRDIDMMNDDCEMYVLLEKE